MADSFKVLFSLAGCIFPASRENRFAPVYNEFAFFFKVVELSRVEAARRRIVMSRQNDALAPTFPLFFSPDPAFKFKENS